MIDSRQKCPEILIKGGKMRKIILTFLLLGVILVTACGTQEEASTEQEELKNNQIYVYCVNSDKTDIVKKVYSFDEDKDLSQNVSEIIEYLSDLEKTEEYQTPIPEGIEYIGNDVKSHHGWVQISFSILYDTVDADSLLFFKACVVETLLQIDDMEVVTISLTDLANSDPETATVTESFNQDSFTMSFGNANGYEQKGAIVIYFANESGEALKEYRKTVEISNNTSLARVVVEALIQGPEEEGYQATIPAATTIRNISVKDGICYIDLSDEFYDMDNPLKNDIIVYSIVNSLAELPTVSKVQFLKNGEKQQFFRETMPFDGIFERNLDLIEEDIEE